MIFFNFRNAWQFIFNTIKKDTEALIYQVRRITYYSYTMVLYILNYMKVKGQKHENF